MAIEDTWRMKRELLSVLRDCGGMLMTENALLSHLQLVCSPTPTTTEFHDALASLESRHYVVRIRPAGDLGPMQVGITDNGRAALAAG